VSGSTAASADIGERKRHDVTPAGGREPEKAYESDIGTCGGDAGEPLRPAVISVTLVQMEESLRKPVIMTLRLC
jgi:hypothetical protein